MTTTEHKIADQPSQHGIARSSGGWLACNCGEGRFSDAEMARHLLDVGRDEGRQEGYDAGLAAAKGEPVTIDDRRVKPGARVRVEEIDGHGDMVAREGIVRNGRVLLSVAGVLIDGATSIYLLAEAPDPDAEVLAAMRGASYSLHARAERADPLPGLPEYGDFLAALRERNFDVVKAVAK